MDRSFGRIQFGPGSVIYLVVTALIAFAAFYTQANLLFWALGLVVGALAVSLVAALISLRGLEVHRLTPSRGVVDEPLVLRYHLVNRSRLAWFSVEIIEHWGGRWRGRLRVGATGDQRDGVGHRGGAVGRKVSPAGRVDFTRRVGHQTRYGIGPGRAGD